MTFLEQAAIAAMQGILSRPIASVHTPKEVAKMAQEHADALAERFKLEVVNPSGWEGLPWSNQCGGGSYHK